MAPLTNVTYTNFNQDDAHTNRILVLQPREGENTKTDKGMVDNRLFKGSNQLHAIMDNHTLLWRMKYESGGLPEPLKGSFTSFTKLLDHARRYFDKRGVDIVEVKEYAPSRYV